jgi:hypothetical protein
MIDRHSIWDSAGKAGLVLGGICVLYLALTVLTGMIAGSSQTVAVIVSVLNALLWAAKFFGCLFLLRYFMLRFSASNPEAGSSDVFRFGTVTALLSALVYSGCYLAYVSLINPDIFSESMQILKDNPMMDKATMEAMENMIPMMPTYAFFGNLIYCWIFGTILSAIYSRNIPSNNPF